MNSYLDPERVDCHIHAGLERRESLEQALATLRDRNQCVVGLLDHVELYLKEPPPWADLTLVESAQRLEEPDLVDLFRKRLGGPDSFYRQVRKAVDEFGRGMSVGVGIEVSGATLGQVDPAWLDGADFLGICTTQPSAGTKMGEHLADLIRQADKLRGGRDMGLVLHHPFRWRLLELARSPDEIPTPAGGFTSSDARTTAAALADAGAVAEVNFASFTYMTPMPKIAEAARQAFELLRDAGVKFSLGSDSHYLTSPDFKYEPAKVLEAFGLSVEDLQLPVKSSLKT